MRRSFVGSAIALAAVLTFSSGCTAAPPPPEATAQPQTANVPERTVLSAGDSVTMRNGLTLTIPSGWTGVLKSGADDSSTVIGVLGRPGATQSLRLRRIESAGGLAHISVSSAPESEAMGSRLTRVGELGAVTLFRTGDTASDVPVLLIAQTHLPGSQYGAVLFRGVAGDANAAVEEVWRLLKVDGAPLTGTSTVALR